MAGSRHPNAEGAPPVNVRDGTLCRAESPRPGSVSPDPLAKRHSKLKILAFDGAKVHDLLFHVALAEVEWQDLDVNPRSALDAPVPKDRVNERASMLYEMFLDSCSKSPKAATAFLAEQHNLQKQYLLKSQAIFKSVAADYAKQEILLSRMLFGAQAVESAASAGIAIASLFLTGPEIVAGAGIELGHEVVMEFIKRTGSSNEVHADAVVVGFQQTVANEAVAVAGDVRHGHLELTKEVLDTTLRYPKRSSIYRSVVAGGARLDALLKTLGVISAGVTLYTASREVWASYEEIQRTNSTH